MIKSIVFDFDGVVVESVAIKTNAFAKLFNQEGEEVVRQVVDYHLRNTGVSRFDKFRYIYKEILNRKLTEDDFHNLCRRFSDLVVNEVVNAGYVEGAKEFLDRYSGIYKCFIASATPTDELVEIISRRKMSDYFKGIYGAPRKKNEILKEIMNKTGLLPDEIVFIGDAISDYMAAKDNNANFIARIGDHDEIFNEIHCVKVRDLTGLNSLIQVFNHEHGAA